MNAHRPLPETFRVRLTMESDWHVGSGTGRPGNIDRLVVRDAENLPFVPAKTLRGIWRDACERLARGLDDGSTGEWCSLVDRVFGSQPALGAKGPTRWHEDPSAKPIESALTVRPARLHDDLRKRIKAKREFREVMTFVKPGVKIERRSGRAQTDFLRFEEMARVGTVLEADCGLNLPAVEGLREAASALLIAGAKLVERLGGKRRRGPGRCKMEIIDHNAERAVAWLETNETPPAWQDDISDRSVPTPSEAAPLLDPWVVVPLVLSLSEPLAVSYRTVGNVVETLDFLPGSYLLPHVTRTLTKLGIDPRAAIQRGDLCVLPATLEIEGIRSRSVPMALFTGKVDPSKIVNRLLAPEPSEQVKQLREGYVGAELPPRKLSKVVRTHNTVKDDLQRPTSDVGGVYTYEAIAPVDQGRPVQLRSELRLRKSMAARLPADWTAKLSRRVSLGRSKKDDYGEVDITAGAAVDFASSTVATSNEFVVWVLSDTLLRDEHLRPVPTGEALGAELSRRLGVSLSVRSPGHCLSELVRVRRFDPWHVGWGLPRPSLVALQAGSCVVFTADQKIDISRLREIEASGVGERTAEGYGQVCFNDPLVATVPSAKWRAEVVKPGDRPVGSPEALDDENAAYARLLEAEAWKQFIRRAALAIAADHARRQDLLKWNVADNRPPMSQLGGLRSQASQLLQREAVNTAIGWLNHLQDKPNRERKWPEGAINAIRELLQAETRVWDVLECHEWPTLTDGAENRLRRELWPLAVRTLVDACIRAHKREVEVKHGA